MARRQQRGRQPLAPPGFEHPDQLGVALGAALDRPLLLPGEVEDVADDAVGAVHREEAPVGPEVAVPGPPCLPELRRPGRVPPVVQPGLVVRQPGRFGAGRVEPHQPHPGGQAGLLDRHRQRPDQPGVPAQRRHPGPAEQPTQVVAVLRHPGADPALDRGPLVPVPPGGPVDLPVQQPAPESLAAVRGVHRAPQVVASERPADRPADGQARSQHLARGGDRGEAVLRRVDVRRDQLIDQVRLGEVLLGPVGRAGRADHSVPGRDVGAAQRPPGHVIRPAVHVRCRSVPGRDGRRRRR